MAENFFTEATAHATTIYNSVPHENISKGNTPYDSYFSTVTKDHTFPSFLEDCLIHNAKTNELAPAIYLTTDRITHLKIFRLVTTGEDVSTNDFKQLDKFEWHPIVNDLPSPTRPPFPFGDKPGRPRKIHTLNSFVTEQPPLTSSPTAPKSFAEAMKIPKWVEAIRKEVQTFLDADAFAPFIPTESEVTFLASFWIFVIKPDGTYKARLIIISPEELKSNKVTATSPVVKQTTVMAFLAAHIKNDRKFLTAFDVKGAFLNTPVSNGKFYRLKTPKGFDAFFSQHYVTIRKQVYGLKDSPMGFYLFARAQLAPDFRISRADSCLFLHHNDPSTSCISHVDDFLVSSNTTQTIEHTIGHKFVLKRQINPARYIGFELDYPSDSITLSTADYFLERIKQFDIKLQSTIKQGATHPLTTDFNDQSSDVHTNLKQANLDSLPIDPTLYRQIVGVIQYIASKTRFDLQFTGTYLSRFNHAPTFQSLNQAIQALKYIYTTRNSAYRTTKPVTGSNSRLQIFTDASFNTRASDDLNAKHHPPFAGYIILLDGNVLTSRSYTIKAATISSVYEAELVALHDGVRRTLAILPTLQELGYKDVMIDAFCDNNPLIQVVCSLKQVDYELHFLNRINYLRDNHSRKIFRLNHISGKDNPADILTKRMPAAEIMRILSKCDFFISPLSHPSASNLQKQPSDPSPKGSEPGGVSGVGFP